MKSQDWQETDFLSEDYTLPPEGDLYIFGFIYADEFLRAYLEDEDYPVAEPGHEDWRDADELDDD